MIDSLFNSIIGEAPTSDRWLMIEQSNLKVLFLGFFLGFLSKGFDQKKTFFWDKFWTPKNRFELKI